MTEHFNGVNDYHKELYADYNTPSHRAAGAEIEYGDFNLFYTPDEGDVIHFVGRMFYGKPSEGAEPCYFMKDVKITDCDDYYLKSPEELSAMAAYIESIIPTSAEIQGNLKEIDEWYELDAYERGQDAVREWDE